MEIIHSVLDLFLHLDQHLNEWVAVLGPWSYLLLFMVIFCETGLVVTPFLPGDSLLFALGALAATEGSVLNVSVLAVLLIAAALLGNTTNYSIGRRIGPKIFDPKLTGKTIFGRFLKREHLMKTQDFYERHGGKAIILTRFVPIIRTFAPFVAGIGQMSYTRFMVYNVVGGVSWVLIFLLAGYQFGGLESVKHNFHIVIFGILFVSVLPIAFEWIRGTKRTREAKRA